MFQKLLIGLLLQIAMKDEPGKLLKRDCAPCLLSSCPTEGVGSNLLIPRKVGANLYRLECGVNWFYKPAAAEFQAGPVAAWRRPEAGSTLTALTRPKGWAPNTCD